MILTITEDIQKFFNDITKFIEENYANPLFWIILVIVIVLITFLAINNLSEK